MDVLVVTLAVGAAAAFLLYRGLRVARGDVCGCGLAGACPAATDLAAELHRFLQERLEDRSSEPPAAILR